MKGFWGYLYWILPRRINHLTKKNNVNNTGHSEGIKSDACLFGLLFLKPIKHALFY